MTSHQTLGNPPPRKATLYCPECGHESRVDGDWKVRVHGECSDYDCPECEMTITSRPNPDRMLDRSEGSHCYCLTP